MKKLILIIFTLLGIVQQANAGIIWSEDFDEITWAVSQPNNGSSDLTPYQGEGTIPTGFHSMYLQASRFSPNDHDSIYIDDKNYRGASGQGCTFYMESYNDWSSDSILGVNLNTGYDELYISYYIKYQPSWQWTTTIGTHESEMKSNVRVSHWASDSGGMWDFHDPSRDHHPLADFHLAKFWNGSSSANDGISFIMRCDTTQYPSNATPQGDDSQFFYFEDGNYSGTGTNLVNDSNWHQTIVRIKLNTAAGTADGIMQWWVDGVLEGSKTDIAFIDQGGDINNNWDYVMLSGNDLNQFSDPSNRAEQWYAMDDVVVATTYQEAVDGPQVEGTPIVVIDPSGTPAKNYPTATPVLRGN